MSKEKVYLCEIEHYDAQQVEAGIREAAQNLNVSLPTQGEVFLHIDCPWADSRYAPHAHTHPALIEGVARALSGSSSSMGTSNLPEFPTRYSYRQAGYDTLARNLGARLVAFDEDKVSPVELAPHAKVDRQADLPLSWQQAGFRVAMPKLRCSTLVSFAGSLRHLQSLLPQSTQDKDSHRLPEKMVDLLPAVSPDLIVVDAIQALHNGGELSGEPVPLGLLIVGTHPLAVDLVSAVALGLEPSQVDFLREAASRDLGPTSLDEIEVAGSITLTDLRSRAQEVRHVDPDPSNYPLPKQVKILRSEKARQAGAMGKLTDVLFLLEHAGYNLKSATETTIVIGTVDQIPPPKSDTAVLIFMDDTSRGDYSGYSRIVRLPGRNIAMSKILNDVPYAMKVVNLRAELGASYLIAGLRNRLSRNISQAIGGRG